MGNEDAWIGEAAQEEETEENAASGSTFGMRPEEGNPSEEPAFDMAIIDLNSVGELEVTPVVPTNEEEQGDTLVDLSPDLSPEPAAAQNWARRLAQNGRDIDERARRLHQAAMSCSLARFGPAGWTSTIDEDAALASHLAEAGWWEDDLTLNEATLLMSEIFSKMVQECKRKEEREAEELAASTAAIARAAERDQEEHGCESGTCGDCWRCDGEAHCEVWAAGHCDTPSTEIETTSEVQVACDRFSTPIQQAWSELTDIEKATIDRPGGMAAFWKRVQELRGQAGYGNEQSQEQQCIDTRPDS